MAREQQTQGLMFWPAIPYNSGGNGASSVAVADVNGDGKPDLVVTNLCANSESCAYGSVSVLLGNGDGTFQPPVSYNSGGTLPNSLVVADVNGDGKPDLVVTSGSTTECDSTPQAALRGTCHPQKSQRFVLLHHRIRTIHPPDKSPPGVQIATLKEVANDSFCFHYVV